MLIFIIAINATLRWCNRKRKCCSGK